jgi:hypothetical protein
MTERVSRDPLIGDCARALVVYTPSLDRCSRRRSSQQFKGSDPFKEFKQFKGADPLNCFLNWRFKGSDPLNSLNCLVQGI